MADKEKLGELFVEVTAEVDQLKKDFATIKRQAEKEGEEVGNSFSEGFKKVLKGGAILLGLKKAFDFGKAIINTASEFEQLQTRLVALYGDVKVAKNVFNEFKKVAATTPFDLKSVVKGGITLKAFGLDAKNTLKTAADLAAFMGTTVPEAAGAMGRAFAAGAGAADILRERGVLNLIKEFTGVEDLTKLTLPKFREAMLQTFQDPKAGIAGATSLLADTFGGAVSNAGDAIENFAAALGTKLLPSLLPIVRGITSMVKGLTPAKTAMEELQEEGASVKLSFDRLSGSLLQLKGKQKLSTEETKYMGEIIDELNKEYPNYLKNINLEAAGYEDTAKAVADASRELDKYLERQIQVAIAAEKRDDFIQVGKDLYASTKALTDAEAELAKMTGFETANAFQTLYGSRYPEAIKRQEELIQFYKDNISVSKEKRDEIQKEIQAITDLLALGSAEPPRDLPGDDETGDDPVVEKAKKRQKELHELMMNGIDLEKAAQEELTAYALELEKQRTDGVIAEAEKRAEAMKKVQGKIAGYFMTFFGQIERLSTQSNNFLVKGFVAVANRFITEVQRMIAKYLAFQAIKYATGGTGSFDFAAALLGGQHGGKFNRAPGAPVKKAQLGTSFTVPPSAVNDSMPLMVDANEEVSITSRGRSSNQENLLNDIVNRVEALNANVISGSPVQQQGEKTVKIQGEIADSAIKISNDRGAKRVQRYR